jgi:hypothetical protein
MGKNYSLKTDKVCGKYFHEGSILSDERNMSLPPEQTGCGAHPVSYKKCTMRSSPHDKTAMA